MGLDYSDARPSYFNLFTEPRTPRRMFENIGPGQGLESGKRNWGPAVEADVIRRAAAGSGGKRGAAVEADAAIGPGSSS